MSEQELPKMTELDWVASDRFRPADKAKVWIMDSSGHVQAAIYRSGLWFLGDEITENTIYIYFTPPFWKLRK